MGELARGNTKVVSAKSRADELCWVVAQDAR